MTPRQTRLVWILGALMAASVLVGVALHRLRRSSSKPALALYPDHRVTRDLDYAGDGHLRHRLDLYLPTQHSATPSPVVLFIHAGGWESGEKESADILLPYLIHATPYAGVSINYRLTDEQPWPAQHHDCQAAMRWLKNHAAQHHLDPNRIAVVGISAGAHLAMMLGLSTGTSESVDVCAVIAFSGAYDFLTWDPHQSVHDPENPAGIIPKLLGGTVSTRPFQAVAASPVFHVTPRAAPTLLIHGDDDHIVSRQQTLEMHATLLTAGASSYLVTGLGGGHYFLPQDLIQAMRDFLAWRLLGTAEQPPAHREVKAD